MTYSEFFKADRVTVNCRTVNRSILAAGYFYSAVNIVLVLAGWFDQSTRNDRYYSAIQTMHRCREIYESLWHNQRHNGSNTMRAPESVGNPYSPHLNSFTFPWFTPIPKWNSSEQ
ncbi:hypothetical protein BDW60DRAFT_194794 [Aspergillus nidulans var. acristatus]